MPSTRTLDYQHVRELLRIVEEAREIRSDTASRRLHLVSGLLELLGADTAGLVDYARAPSAGTAGRNVLLVGFSPTEELEARRIYGSTEGSLRNPALPAVAELSRAGPAVARREEMIGDREWYHSEYVANVRSRWRIDNVMYGTRTDAGGAVGFSFARALGRPRFSEEERNLVQLFNECFGHLFFEVEHPLARLRRSLAPREREALDGLLRGEAAKEIAERMRLSVHTVNQYTRRIFAVFKVTSRAQLLAAWHEEKPRR